MKSRQLLPIREGGLGKTTEPAGKYFSRGEWQNSTHTHDVEVYEAGPYRLARSIQEPCVICEAENAAFEQLASGLGEYRLEGRMSRLDSYRAYAQRYPFDMREMVLSTEVVFGEKDADVYDTREAGPDLLERLIDEEAFEAVLSVLTPEQALVVRRTYEGYKPREIAEQKGDKDSARVRQDKYSAMRTLGVPVNRKMRRVKDGNV